MRKLIIKTFETKEGCNACLVSIHPHACYVAEEITSSLRCGGNTALTWDIKDTEDDIQTNDRRMHNV